MITGIHHIAIICSDYAASKHFYHTILGFEIVGEHFRAARNSWKLDLKVSGSQQIELFSFPNAPERPSYPEALGLRHLCFSVADLDKAVTHLNENGISTEPIRVDEYTGKRFVFFADPDKLPIELYEA